MKWAFLAGLAVSGWFLGWDVGHQDWDDAAWDGTLVLLNAAGWRATSRKRAAPEPDPVQAEAEEAHRRQCRGCGGE
jgi:hypothetical protein